MSGLPVSPATAPEFPLLPAPFPEETAFTFLGRGDGPHFIPKYISVREDLFTQPCHPTPSLPPTKQMSPGRPGMKCLQVRFSPDPRVPVTVQVFR